MTVSQPSRMSRKASLSHMSANLQVTFPFSFASLAVLAECPRAITSKGFFDNTSSTDAPRKPDAPVTKTRCLSFTVYTVPRGSTSTPPSSNTTFVTLVVGSISADRVVLEPITVRHARRKRGKTDIFKTILGARIRLKQG